MASKKVGGGLSEITVRVVSVKHVLNESALNHSAKLKYEQSIAEFEFML